MSASPHDISPGPVCHRRRVSRVGVIAHAALIRRSDYSGQAHLSWKAPKRRDRPSYRRESGGLCMTSGDLPPGRRISLNSQGFQRQTFREDMRQPVCGGEIVRDACGFLRGKAANNSANRSPLRSNFSACRNVQLRRITRSRRRDFFEGLSVQVSVCPEWLPTFGEFLREFLLHLPPAQFF